MCPSKQHVVKETKNKEPWLAVNLSSFLPGIGQIYAGSKLKGYIILLSYFLMGVIGALLLLVPIGNPLLGITLLIVASLILPIWNLFDAHYSARIKNFREFEATRKQSKDAWLAVFLSTRFTPGIGHAYLKQWSYSILFFSVFIAAFMVTLMATAVKNPLMTLLGGVTQFIIILGVAYNAYVSAPVRRERSRRAIILVIAGFIGTTIPTSILPLGVRRFVAEARYIPSSSMQPTLQVSDRILINKLIYRFHAPERGDVIVFLPTNSITRENPTLRDEFVQRVIGLPGEKVQVKDGQVYINEQPLRESYISESEAPQYTWGPVVVPPKSYFVLGDSRNNSYDSHFWGFVPRKNIIGKATKRCYPFGRAGSL